MTYSISSSVDISVVLYDLHVCFMPVCVCVLVYLVPD